MQSQALAFGELSSAFATAIVRFYGERDQLNSRQFLLLLAREGPGGRVVGGAWAGLSHLPRGAAL